MNKEEIKKHNQTSINMYIESINKALEKYNSSARIRVEQKEDRYFIYKYFIETFPNVLLYTTDNIMNLYIHLDGMMDGIDCFFELYVFKKRLRK